MKTNATAAALLVMILGERLLQGQVNSNVSRQPRRALGGVAREQAVTHAGPGSREFVESLGEDAVAALATCSQDAARRLVEFHASGKLGKLSRPRDLLRA